MLNIKNVIISSLITLVSILIVLFLHLSNSLDLLNDLIYDKLMILRLSQPKIDNRIQLVTIDQETLNNLGKWPWKNARKYHAKVLDTINQSGAKVIFFNFLIVEPDPHEDIDLINTLKRYSNVLLPVYYDYNTQTFTTPYTQVLKHAKAVGNIAAFPTSDGITRQVDIQVSNNGSTYWNIALEIVRAFYNLPQNSYELIPFNILKLGQLHIPLDSKQKLRINYKGTKVYPSIPYYKVLNKNFSKDTFKDKIVLIGADFIGSGDYLSIPLSPSTLVPTIHVQAQLIGNILNGQTLYFYPKSFSYIFIVLLGIFTVVLFKIQKNIYKKINLFILLISLFILFSYILLNFYNIIIDLFTFLLLIVVLFFILIIEDIIKANLLLIKQNEELTNMYNKLKETQEQLILAEKISSLAIFSAGLAHEINNPLNYLNGNLKILSEYMNVIIKVLTSYENILKENNLEYKIKEIKEQNDLNYIINSYEKIIKNSKNGLLKIQNIVNNLLSLSRDEHKEFINVNIIKVIDNVLEMIQSELNNKIQVHKNYNLNNIKVKGNPGQLEQVFMNILLNATQSIKDKGDIWINLDTANNYIIIEIANSGEYINNEIINKIFDPFFTTKKVGKGTGLGLTLVYNIIKKHNGEVTVKNNYNNDNKRVSFIIKLPLNK